MLLKENVHALVVLLLLREVCINYNMMQFPCTHTGKRSEKRIYMKASFAVNICSLYSALSSYDDDAWNGEPWNGKHLFFPLQKSFSSF